MRILVLKTLTKTRVRLIKLMVQLTLHKGLSPKVTANFWYEGTSVMKWFATEYSVKSVQHATFLF